MLERQGATRDIDIALGLDALGGIGAGVDGERTALDEHMAIKGAIGCVLGIDLDTIVTATDDVDVTTIHLEVLHHVDSIGHGTGDGDVAQGLFDLHILVAGQGMLLIARDGERAALAELGMALDQEGCLLGAGSAVSERVARAIGQLHGDALAVLDIDGGAVGVGQVHAIEHQCHLVLARMVEAAARAIALQGVGVFAGHIGILHDGDACTGHLCGDVVGDVPGHKHVGTAAIILDQDIVVGQRLAVDGHAVHIGEGKPLVQHGEKIGRTIGHRSHRFGVVGPMDMARVYPHGLSGLSPNTYHSNHCC